MEDRKSRLRLWKRTQRWGNGSLHSSPDVSSTEFKTAVRRDWSSNTERSRVDAPRAAEPQQQTAGPPETSLTLSGTN